MLDLAWQAISLEKDNPDAYKCAGNTLMSLESYDDATINLSKADVVSSIQASSQMQEKKATSLEAFQEDTERFIEDAVRIDNEAADVIRQRKDDFYEQYNYLKPDIEKNWIENILDTTGQWCREHWKIIVTVVLVVVAVILICTGAGGLLAAIVFEMCKGLS